MNRRYQINMCDAGAVNLQVGIVSQAVADYVNALKRIHELGNIEKAHKAIIKKAMKGKCPKLLTEEEAEQERLHMIARQNSVLQEIERFFHSKWYKELCDLDGDYLLARAKEKYEEWLKDN